MAFDNVSFRTASRILEGSHQSAAFSFSESLGIRKTVPSLRSSTYPKISERKRFKPSQPNIPNLGDALFFPAGRLQSTLPNGAAIPGTSATTKEHFKSQSPNDFQKQLSEARIIRNFA